MLDHVPNVLGFWVKIWCYVICEDYLSQIWWSNSLYTSAELWTLWWIAFL